MFFLLSLIFNCLLVITHAKPLTSKQAHIARKRDIQWAPCNLTGTAPILCGSLPVPLDYTDSSSTATLDLELLKIPASKNSSRDSIFFNFGGPGDDGSLDFAILGAQLLSVTGGYHDLITFAPRGTGNTLRFSCYNSSFERTLGQLNWAIGGNSSDVAEGRIWGGSQILADTCYSAQNKTGGLLGTAFVARDMMKIVDALGEDGLLRYWGFSYGTVLGATAAAMFPDRMDKVVLDGVVNPHQYYHDNEVELFTDTDAVLAGFCSGCVADPDHCPVARNRTASELQDAIFTLLENVKQNPIVVPVAGSGFLADYSIIKSLTFGILYSPAAWHSYAAVLDSLLEGNLSGVSDYFNALISAPAGVSDEAEFGIKCSDKIPRASHLVDVLPEIEARHQRSRIGGDTADAVTMGCARWRMEARERYAGDFQVRTRNPMLVIGNTFDPVTPLVSARNASSGFEGSVLLQHDGYGHSSLGQGSLCTGKAIRAYFANGTLPSPGTVCKVDGSLFAGKSGWDEIVQQLNQDPL